MNLPTRITAQALLGLTLIVASDARADACESARRDLDARIAEAGHPDPRHDRLQSTRWLRQTPFLHAELSAAGTDSRSARIVLEAMAALDQSSLALELGNDVDDLPAERCWAEAVEAIIASQTHLHAIRSEEPDDHYRAWPRTLGPYLVAKPFLRRGAAQWRARELEAISKGRGAAALSYRPEAPIGAERGGALTELAQALEDARGAHPLAWPVLAVHRLDDAFSLFAPSLQTSEVSEHARIGQLRGDPHRPIVDTSAPTAYAEAGYVRYGDEVLLQLSYTFWFTERPRTGPLDPYGGPVDGLVLRTTIASDGRPLLWESIHPCGCYYTVFLPEDRALTYEPPAPSDLEAPIVLAGPPSGSPVALHYTPDTHYARFLTNAEEEGAGPTPTPYALAPYAALLEADALRPPFDANGILRGTARGERWFLWPSGIASPGAMRSSGRQATAFLGTRSFDRAELLGGRLRSGAH